MEGYWEFMGGKQEEMETGEKSAIKEIWEELGTDISSDSRLCTITHQYSHGLLSFHVERPEGTYGYQMT